MPPEGYDNDIFKTWRGFVDQVGVKASDAADSIIEAAEQARQEDASRPKRNMADFHRRTQEMAERARRASEAWAKSAGQTDSLEDLASAIDRLGRLKDQLGEETATVTRKEEPTTARQLTKDELAQVKFPDKYKLWEDLGKKDLFYNEKEGKQIQSLAQMLEPGAFREVQERLEKLGERKGVCILFYGAAGVGKTESVYQLAIAGQRDIYPVDITEIRNSAVGETEKRAKQIFNNYRKCVDVAHAKGRNTPILLLNEADSIIQKRSSLSTSGANSVVAQSENSAQNIILEEFEKFDGILIATTNLKTNFDRAYERRFLYKVEFEKPGPEVQKKIWLSKFKPTEDIQGLSEEVVDRIVAKYDELAGGNIENIHRKYVIQYATTGKYMTEQELMDECEAEMS